MQAAWDGVGRCGQALSQQMRGCSWGASHPPGERPSVWSLLRLSAPEPDIWGWGGCAFVQGELGVSSSREAAWSGARHQFSPVTTLPLVPPEPQLCCPVHLYPCTLGAGLQPRHNPLADGVLDSGHQPIPSDLVKEYLLVKDYLLWNVDDINKFLGSLKNTHAVRSWPMTLFHIAFAFLYSAFLDITTLFVVRWYQLSPSSLHMSSEAVGRWFGGGSLLGHQELWCAGEGTGPLWTPVSSSVSQWKCPLLKPLVFYEDHMLLIF